MGYGGMAWDILEGYVGIYDQYISYVGRPPMILDSLSSRDVKSSRRTMLESLHRVSRCPVFAFRSVRSYSTRL